MTSANVAVLAALDGIHKAQQTRNAAAEAVSGGSLDAAALAEAAVVLRSGQAQGQAAMAALAVGLKLQRSFVDILA